MKVKKSKKYLELANAYRTYEELKVKEGVCDYSDLISHVHFIYSGHDPIFLRGISRNLNIFLLMNFRIRILHKMNWQYYLAGKKKNITVVGDDDQAIYRWRGAAVSNMIQFRKTFPKAKIIVLTKNYRSTKEILDRSYDLIQNNNPDRLEVAEKIDKKLESMRRINGEPITVALCRPCGKRSGCGCERPLRKFFPIIKNIHIQILRYWYGQIIMQNRLRGRLGRAGIPYQFLGPGQLFRQPEVKDLIAYLKVLYNFEDNVAMYRVLTMDWLDIAPRDVAVLSNYAKKYGISLFESCEKLVAK